MRRVSIAIVTLLALLLTAGQVLAKDTSLNKKPQGKPVNQQWVQMKNLPPAVQKTIKKLSGDHIIVSLKKLDYKNETRYSARWVEGENLEIIHVSPKGEYLYHKTRPLDNKGNEVDNNGDEYDGGC